MKKIILGATALIMCVALAGCGSSTTSAITSLENQLDETANTISSLQSVNPSDISLTQSMLENSESTSDDILNNSQNAQQSLANEEYYKMDILNKTAQIKNNLSKDLKLSKSQISAVNDLTSSLNRYTNSVAYTKNEMDSAVKSISSMKKNVDKNTDKINAKLNRLACNSNARSTYYQNILNTLEQIGNYVGCENCENEDMSRTFNMQRNDSPRMFDRSMSRNELRNNERFDEEFNNLSNNTPASTFTNNTYNSNNFNRLNAYRNGYAGNYGNGFGYRNGMYGTNGYYGTNGFYGSRFNPDRNTDTYAPLMRNIDTYQVNNLNGLNGVVATTKPEQRLEDFEQLNEDNTVEKVKNDEITEKNEENVSTLSIEKQPQIHRKRFDKTKENEDKGDRVIAHVRREVEDLHENNDNMAHLKNILNNTENKEKDMLNDKEKDEKQMFIKENLKEYRFSR